MSSSTLWLRFSIFLTAAALRLAGLSHIPPGFTHDEGVHAHTAEAILHGARPLYVPIANGREPLFDYATAGLMSLIGTHGLALRLTAVYASLLLLALSYAWVRRAFNERIALLTTAFFALNFWAVMTARHGLRSITLPLLFTAAVYLWWRVVSGSASQLVSLSASQLVSRSASQLVSGSASQRGGGEAGVRGQSAIPNPQSAILLSGLCLGLAAYTYFPIRLLWLLFPAGVVWWWLVAPAWGRRAARPTGVMLAVAAVLAAPLAIHLWQNPTAEVRLAQLATPLTQAQAGDWQPLLANATAALRSLGVAGAGDGAWRYNLPGQPLLPPLVAWLALLGLLPLLWRWRTPAHGFVLGWLLLALLPVLVTGSELSVPRAIGLQPVLFLLPALALDWGLGYRERSGVSGQGSAVRGQGAGSPVDTAGGLAIAFILGLMLLQTVQGYFVDWATAPEVAVQYETAVVSAVVAANQTPAPHVAISAPTPGRYHAQPLGWLAGQRRDVGWFDGRRSLLLPRGTAATGSAVLFFAPSAPPPAELGRQLAPWQPVGGEMLAYTAEAQAVREAWLAIGRAPAEEVLFGQTVRLVRYETAVADGQLHLWTLWEVVGAGTGTADVRLFAQLVGEEGVLAQEDRLDVPSDQWRKGDWFWQWQVLGGGDMAAVPEGATLIVGFYEVAEPQARWPLGRGGDFYIIGNW